MYSSADKALMENLIHEIKKAKYKYKFLKQSNPVYNLFLQQKNLDFKLLKKSRSRYFYLDIKKVRGSTRSHFLY